MLKRIRETHIQKIRKNELLDYIHVSHGRIYTLGSAMQRDIDGIKRIKKVKMLSFRFFFALFATFTIACSEKPVLPLILQFPDI